MSVDDLPPPPVEDAELSRLLGRVVTTANDAVLITEAEPIDAAQGGPRIVYANEAFERMTGYVAADVIGKTPRILGCEMTDEAELRKIRVALERWEPIETELLNRRKDGRPFWVQVSIAPARDGDGRYTHWISIQRDVTERRRRDETVARSLQAARERLRGAFAHAPIGMAVTTPAGVVLDGNPALLQLLGMTRDELLGTTFFDITHPDDDAKVREACARLSRDGGTSRVECRFIHPSGRTMHIVVQSSLVHDDQGAPDHVVMHVEDATERTELEHRLLRQALSDELTGLPNRTMLLDRLQQATARRNRDGSDVALLFVDVDSFKDINDRFGHGVGDTVLRTMAQRLRASIRPGDTVARFAGDEFVVLCEQTGAEEAEVVAERLAAAAREPLDLPTGRLVTTISVGIAVADDGTDAEADALLRSADAAMYEAKNRGRGRQVLFDAFLRARDAQRREVEDELRLAIEREELRLHFQPQIDLSDGSVSGREALVRWEHPTRGLLLPGHFIGVAERNDLIMELGAWVLGTACRHAAADASAPVVWVNVSPRQLHAGFVDEVARTLEASGVAPERIGLELTESVLMTDLGLARRQLAGLRDLGVALAIDDFGSGYSSLAYLAELPVDMVKIDRSLTAAVETKEQSAAVVSAVMAMASALGLTVLVEGIETDGQLRAVRELGVRFVQGFLFGKPAPTAAS